MKENYVYDGHIHSPYCPHGTKDTFHMYIEKALLLGYKEMTFSEHAPLPLAFTDPTPQKDSAIKMEQLHLYLSELKQIKDIYKDEIKINIGLEIDFIEGYEEDTKILLNEWGQYIDDSILSVHFLKKQDKYMCLDFSAEEFKSMIKEFGSLEKLYDKYFETLLLSIESDLGKYKPNRIGHITLVRKFQRLHERSFDDHPYILKVLHALKSHQLSLDLNGAGLVKEHCKEFYPPLSYAKKAMDMGIPLIYGSDAHRADMLGTGLDDLLHVFNNR
ncbi:MULTISPECIES: histidinol-phosphatase HisJ [Bacillaceae]|uniref:Histidinol-phosphatase n=1 Tax=Evansella alkalicola TaxID=745819 RepID=A0ABS6JRC3_9BACI|nr:MULTISPECIES: histidinol-phosphatase HisJ [Bacillaceae]MBU9721108.1 histidinol-phosphatase HisJ [Bacillus alkalicola]